MVHRKDKELKETQFKHQAKGTRESKPRTQLKRLPTSTAFARPSGALSWPLETECHFKLLLTLSYQESSSGRPHHSLHHSVGLQISAEASFHARSRKTAVYVTRRVCWVGPPDCQESHKKS